MSNPSVNLRDLRILIADPSAYTRRVIVGILRGFGANRFLEVDRSLQVLGALTSQKIDILLCDEMIPEKGGLALTRTIRLNERNENRTIPILIMSSNPSEASIKSSRDAGANMVIAKPISPKNLYDRIYWIAYTSRPFVDTANYFGPDRRFKIEGYPNGVGRRKGDKSVDVAADVGPALAQDDIDNLFSAVRTGNS